METREIARSEWFGFFEAFTKQHQGETATVTVVGDDVGAQEAVTSLPFQGVSADQKGSDKGSIRIVLGTEPNDHVEHVVEPVTRIYIKTAGASTGDVVEFEEKDGPKTILQLQPTPALPA
jgi:hypothetical protein